MIAHVGVVEMRRDLQSGVADRIERQCRVVEVDQVRMVLVNEIDGAVVKFLAVRLIGDAAAFGGVPVPFELFPRRVVLRVEVLRIEAFPTICPAAVDAFVQLARYRTETPAYAPSLIRALRGFVPAPCVRGMNRYAEAQAIVARRLCPSANQILLRPDLRRVPRLVGAVVIVEVVMMVREGDEILRRRVTRLWRNAHQFDRVQKLILRVPGVDDVLEAEDARRSVFLQMGFVLARSFHVHVPRVPVPGLGLTLRSPVRPESELGVRNHSGH